jgi:hypothetical protein
VHSCPGGSERCGTGGVVGTSRRVGRHAIAPSTCFCTSLSSRGRAHRARFSARATWRISSRGTPRWRVAQASPKIESDRSPLTIFAPGSSASRSARCRPLFSANSTSCS